MKPSAGYFPSVQRDDQLLHRALLNHLAGRVLSPWTLTVASFYQSHGTATNHPCCHHVCLIPVQQRLLRGPKSSLPTSILCTKHSLSEPGTILQVWSTQEHKWTTERTVSIVQESSDDWGGYTHRQPHDQVSATALSSVTGSCSACSHYFHSEPQLGSDILCKLWQDTGPGTFSLRVTNILEMRNDAHRNVRMVWQKQF